MCDCGAGLHDVGEWNAGHGARWNHFRTVLTREVEGLRFFRACEVQKRGALHHHALVWSPVALAAGRLQEIALRAGYGCVMDLAPVEPGSRKFAYYVSKYVVKAVDSRESVPWVRSGLDYETGEIVGPLGPETYRTWSSSRDWGLTMKAIRADAAEWCRANLPDVDAQALEVVAAVLGGVPVDVDGPAPPG